jgi:hypothetical protein
MKYQNNSIEIGLRIYDEAKVEIFIVLRVRAPPDFSAIGFCKRKGAHQT